MINIHLIQNLYMLLKEHKNSFVSMFSDHI